MKKNIAMLISFMLVFSSVFMMLDMNADVEGKETVPTPLFTGSGSGSVVDPYQISNVDELQQMDSDLSANYTLTNDIDASATAIWNGNTGLTPIGDDITPFRGSLDGQGFDIINLTIDRSTTDYVGLFGYTSVTATITGLGLVNTDIEGQDNVGGIVARNLGTVTDCYSTGVVRGIFDVGGIVGVNNGGTISDSYSTCFVNGISWTAGGFVGNNFAGNISNCYSTGGSTAVDQSGGFAGSNHDNITNCYSTGSASSVDDCVGGFVASNQGTITNCYSTGGASIIATGNDVGGFAGENGGIIKFCSSTGPADGTNVVGGFVGDNTGSIERSYSTGSSNGTNTIGGFAGMSQGSIITSYSISPTTGAASVGGFIGYNQGTITDSYASGDSYGTGDYVGGFVGYTEATSTISNCYSNGWADGAQMVGGFAGQNMGTITTSYATGLGSAPAYNAGGFVGWNQGAISKSYATGNGYSEMGNAGGFAGMTRSGGTIEDCYSHGDASLFGGFIGGFTGRKMEVTSSINNCYSIGTASSVGTLAGFIADNTDAGPVTSSYWDTEASGNPTSPEGGLGQNTSQMKQQATFAGWSFPSVWDIVEGTTYPYLNSLNPIITTTKAATMHFTNERELYNIQFNSIVQPKPDFNKLENWTLNTDAGPWLTINNVGLLSGTPMEADIGTWYVNVSVNDTLDSKASLNFTLTVVNSGPEIITTNVLETVNGTLYSVDYDSTDDPATWNLSSNATWLMVDANGIISGTPTHLQLGSFWVHVSVEDGFGISDFTNFTLTVLLDTDGDTIPDSTDPDDDNDGFIDAFDDFPLDPSRSSDIDGDGIDDSMDTDNDNDGWSDAIEIAGGFDHLDDIDYPTDEDGDGTADFMDPDFLTVTEYNNQTIWDNQTVNQTVWSNNTVPEYHNNIVVEYNNLTIPEYHNTTIWNNGTAEPETETISETPAWAWGAVIAAIVLGILAVVGFMRGGSGGKPEVADEPSEPESEVEPEIEVEAEESTE